MARVAVVLGSAVGNWKEADEAIDLCSLSGVKPQIGAVNEAGQYCPLHLSFWGSLHPDKLGKWAKWRVDAGRNGDAVMIVNKELPQVKADVIYSEPTALRGSSGMFLPVVLHRIYGYQKIILAGIHMGPERRFFDKEDGTGWKHHENYRVGWNRIQDELRPVIRSMGGWTQEMFGQPTLHWIKE